MRGKGSLTRYYNTFQRITPAYAGKRPAGKVRHLDSEDHPRLCGEKSRRSEKWQRWLGSPPPMRGKAGSFTEYRVLTGITPAYAGKSTKRIILVCAFWDHPRLCGEKEM